MCKEKLKEREAVMSDHLRDKPQKREKRTGKAPSEASHGVRAKDPTGRTKESVNYTNLLLSLVIISNWYEVMIDIQKEFPVQYACFQSAAMCP